ncbi:MAG: hypothetical protein AAF438_05710 [Pseudomonadota bacterium]
MQLTKTLFLVVSTGLMMSVNGDSYEPVEAAGEYHAVILENERVRVLSVEIGPGETVPLHQHTMESVFITLQPSELVFRNKEGNVIKRAGPDDFKSLPHTEFRKAAPGPRSVTNTGNVSMRAIRVEFKDGGS